MNFEQFHVLIEIVLTCLMPVFLYALKHLIDKGAEKRAAQVKEALHDHEVEDQRRFDQHAVETQKLMGKMDEMIRIREDQHGENRAILAELRADLRTWKEWYQRWQQSKFGS
jgi:hypothetical protein